MYPCLGHCLLRLQLPWVPYSSAMNARPLERYHLFPLLTFPWSRTSSDSLSLSEEEGSLHAHLITKPATNTATGTGRLRGSSRRLPEG
ncbi:hypothetical protein F2Q69_00048578 [Brassica cretica]|uniref:Uncharacterized protein n=1 Tax=Brassica cretica TaxID=69181 RepID=A0A8S9PK97_BRACR|nr:hypothetical protein F2Q69_00048578 [Brassica cretica]